MDDLPLPQPKPGDSIERVINNQAQIIMRLDLRITELEQQVKELIVNNGMESVIKG